MSSKPSGWRDEAPRFHVQRYRRDHGWLYDSAHVTRDEAVAQALALVKTPEATHVRVVYHSSWCVWESDTFHFDED